MKRIIYIALAFVLTSSLQAQVDRSVQPKPGPAPVVNIGKPQEFELPNGLKVLVVENHKLPRVTFTLALDNKPNVEGDIKGVDDLTSSMMGNGTSAISKDDFNEQLDFYGSSVRFSVNNIGGSSLSKYFPQTLSLAAKGALDPLFTQEELDSERAKLLDALKADEKSTKAIANRVRSVLIYGKNHPSGEYLSEESINKVTLDNIKSYYKTYFVPEKAYLVIVGDITFADAKKLVTESFSSWAKAPSPVSQYTEPVNLVKTEIDFVDVPNAVQSEISVNNVVNLKMTDPDYFAAMLANYILGGSSDSYLFMNLREGHGWTYGSYSNLSGGKYTSDFRAYAAVRNAVTDSAVVEMLNEVKRIRTEVPTEDALRLAKAKFIGSFVMNAEKPQTIASFALREKTQSLPADFYENYIKNIEAVTLEQVQAAARKHVTNEAARIVIAGKASDVLPGLEKIGLPINYFDKYGNPVEKPQAKEVSADVSVKSILEKYIKAIGGEVVLKEIKSLMVTSKAQIQGQELTLVKKETADGKSSQNITMMGMTVLKSVYDGKTGYAEIQGQRKDMTEDDLAELKYSAVFPELLMTNSNSIQLAGIESINNSDAYKLVDGDISFYYDVNTGLKVAEAVKKEVSEGQSIDQIGYYSDYREISGVKIPYKSTLNVGVEVELNVVDIKINEGVSDADFQ
ncbi:M16 family metallopeptidase [Dysgonomonas macrotermitis]|uniref:Predicted Zn-dependent peptidase n=1 Tax=Dysgonomonas macrotermitis TaxID=1346286 RepID=A0A1M5H4F6_9BACT|nr:pitrilysin family protein [Dysgonomonas macrotermitis]SHG10795.1 Predicted Zn-dependent peptidase [Dysgonomonas macrotermitis]